MPIAPNELFLELIEGTVFLSVIRRAVRRDLAAASQFSPV
jgi:hypothetical protein